MKKLIITTVILFGLSFTTFADPDGGGLFMRGESTEIRDGNGMPVLPDHGHSTNQPAPLSTGIALLTTLGAAYLVGKKRKEE